MLNAIRQHRTRFILALATGALLLAGTHLNIFTTSAPTAIAANPKAGDSGGNKAESAGTKVDVMKPHTGGLPRMSVQPGSIHPFESAELYAKVSGYLQILNVDIGDRVKEGQLLAEIDSPELIRSGSEIGRQGRRTRSANARITAAERNTIGTLKRNEYSFLEFG